jgi:hypothetical protein
MTHKIESSFDIVKRMVRDHLADAEKRHPGTGEEPGPTPAQCYTAAFSTATGAYAGRGITAKEWADLHTEIREHQGAFK